MCHGLAGEEDVRSERPYSCITVRRRVKENLAPELLEEARKRQAQEAALAAFDRELEETRRQTLRPRPGQARLDRAVREVEEASKLDVQGPAERLADPSLKRFAEATVAALGELCDALEGHAQRIDGLADRVDALVDELEASRLPMLPAVPTATPAALVRESPLERVAGLAEAAAERLGPATGRVLHADCRDGALVAQLTSMGVAAYGTEPSEALLSSPVEPGLDLVRAEAISHLRSSAAGELGGALLSGFVDRLSVGEARRLAFLLGTRLAPGGVVVLVGTQPDAWEREASPVEQDLAPGRPLHAATWCHLLGAYGFAELATIEQPERGALLVSGTRAG